jgi:aminoglycoside phosphotransferase (APT) family kinase protein
MKDESPLRSRLAGYLQQQTGRPWVIGDFVRYASGFSWITYGFSAREKGSAQERGLILRLGPPYGLFAPYSARPQYMALKALEGNSVPVPHVYWWSDDVSILGAPFFISEKMPGSAPVPWISGGGSPQFEEGHRQRIARQFVSALAGLHTVDWSESEGFADEAMILTVDNAALKQIEFWESAHARWTLRPYPMLRYALLWLRRKQPRAPRVSLIHGDYRLGNFLVQNARITAILDWELVHLGDPHEDLGWAFLPQYAAGTGLVCQLVSREEFIAQYQQEAGFTVDVDSLQFYIVLALMKLALTHIAAVRCFEDGRFDDMRMPAMGTQIAPVLRQIEKALP